VGTHPWKDGLRSCYFSCFQYQTPIEASLSGRLPNDTLLKLSSDLISKEFLPTPRLV